LGSAFPVNLARPVTPKGRVSGAKQDFLRCLRRGYGSTGVLERLIEQRGGWNDYTISSTTITFDTASVLGSVVLAVY
jgi:hypothetical protein